MAESIKKTVIGIKKEVTEGTPVFPSSSTDYIAVQSGFTFSSEFEKIDNLELKPSVAKSAPIIGAESPKASFSHYMRNSHVVGTPPQFAPLIESAIGEMVPASGTERLTTSGSSAGSSVAQAILKLASGGVDFERGKVVLIKDGVNGYAIRPVDSIATNDLTLGFNLSAAPGSGIGVGRAILFKPKDTPPSLTLTEYLAQGGAIEAESGAKTSSMDLSFKARDVLNAAFSFEAINYFFNPIEITSSDVYIDFSDGSTKVASIAAKVYSNPNDTAQAIQDSMNSVSSGFTVVYNNKGVNAGKFTFTKASGTFSLLFATGTNVANGIYDKIGFASTDLTGSLTYTSSSVQSWASPQVPSFDAGEPIIVKESEVLIGDYSDIGCSGVQSGTIKVANTYNKIGDVCSTSGYGVSILDLRESSADLEITMPRHDADKFHKYKGGSTVKFLGNFGVKAGGNWVAGKCVSIYMPQAKISAFLVGETDSVATFKITVSAYTANGEGEFYLNFV